jgi:hypothetical protein
MQPNNSGKSQDNFMKLCHEDFGEICMMVLMIVLLMLNLHILQSMANSKKKLSNEEARAAKVDL